MRRAERNALRARYQFRCGYCGTAEVDAGGELTVDHFQPRAAGGTDAPDNWVYACIVCNDLKGDYWQPDASRRILHPIRDPVEEHFREDEDGRLIPLTDTGQFHVDRLQLNRPQLLMQRRRRRRLQSLRQHLAQLKEEHTALLRHIQAVEEEVDLLLEQAEQETES